MDITLLLARCRAGEARAIEELVEAHRPAVHRVALSILDDPAEADEAAQDTLVSALDALESYRGDSAFTTWLYAITLNVCRGRLRKHRAQERLGQVLNAFFRASGPAIHPEDIAIQDETTAAIWNAVHALDEKHRFPVILRYYHELPIAEIAQIMGVSERTIHTRLHTAHERLKVSLNGRVNSK